MAVNYDFREIQVGSAVNFRENINYNFNLIKGDFQEMMGSISTLQTNVKNLQTQVTNLIENPAHDIVLSATQPQNQKSGDYWLKIIS